MPEISSQVFCKFLSKPTHVELQFLNKLFEMNSTPTPIHNAPPKRRKRHSYAKISLKTKLIFFQRVIREQASTRQMASQLGIKYSTAKTLVRNYRDIFQQQDEAVVRAACQEFRNQIQPKKRCGYAAIEDKHADVTPQGMTECCGGQNRAYSINKIQIISNTFPQREK